MKNKIINAMLYTWLGVLYIVVFGGIVAGAYLLTEFILANLQ